jgi:trk system potassium uptake protein TrkH
MLQTAQDLFWVYVILTLLCAVALWAVGMTAFEALCHAFSTLSTGGFSTRDGGVAAFDNPLAELVLMAFMLVAAMNLTLHWAGFQGRFRAYRDNIEVHYLSVALVILVIAAAGLGVWAEETDFPDGFRGSLFNAISALTTTGFSNAGGGVPIGLPPILIIGLVLVGGAVGSTTGGMRMLRLAVLFKQAQRELLRLLHPHAAVPLKVGPRTVATTTVWGVWSLFFVLILALAATSLVLSLTGLSPEAAVAAAVAAVSNAGPFLPAIEPTAPAYAEMSGTAKLTLAAAMLAGRVELLALLTLANPAYWRD